MSMGSCSIMFSLILGLEIRMMYQCFIRGKEHIVFYWHVFLGMHFWNNLENLYKCDVHTYMHTHKEKTY